MLTVVIPSYNHQSYITECLQAVARIDGFRLKVIVVDDGSTDETPKLVEEFIGSNPHLEIVLIKKKNQGVVSSLNLALNMLESEYVYFCASDDIPIPEGVEYLVSLLQAEKQKAFLIGGSVNKFIDKNNNTYRKSHDIFFEKNESDLREGLFFDYPKPLLLQSSLFRVSALISVGGWDTDVVIDDYSMFIKLFQMFKRSSYDFVPNINVVYYRIHESNSSNNTVRQYITQKELFNKYASSEKLDKAIGYRLSFHFIQCVRRRNFIDIMKLIKVSSAIQIFYGLFYIPLYLIKFIMGEI